MEDGFYWAKIEDDNPEVVQIIGSALLAVDDFLTTLKMAHGIMRGEPLI